MTHIGWGGVPSPSYTSGQDFTGYAQRFVTLDTDNTVVKLAGAGDRVAGLLDLTVPTAAGQSVTLLYDGFRPVVAGAALAQGTIVASDAEGRAVPAAFGDYIAGTVVQAAAAAGEICLVYLPCPSTPAKHEPTISGEFSVNFAEIASQATDTATGVIVGAKVADMVIIQAPSDFPAGLVLTAAITDDDEVTVTAVNATASPIDAPNATIKYLLQVR